MERINAPRMTKTTRISGLRSGVLAIYNVNRQGTDYSIAPAGSLFKSTTVFR